MQQIRLGVFETNSSSVHAIVVRRQEFAQNMNTASMSDNYIVAFRLEDFGWEFRELTTENHKASYLWTLAYSYSGQNLDKLKKVEEKLREMLGDVKPQECLHFTYPTKEENEEYFPIFFVDHDDEKAAHDFYDRALSDKDFLIRFLFNEDSYILTGNDNVDIISQPDELIRPEDKDKSDIFIKRN